MVACSSSDDAAGDGGDDPTTENEDPTINDPDGLYTVADAPTFADGHDPIYDGMVWNKVGDLSDEFNGTELDTDKWCADPEANGWQWLGRAPQLFMPESISVKGGTMQILAGILDEPIEKESYGSTETYKYHSGIVRSLKSAIVGNYYECRMKMNKSELGGGFWVNVQSAVNGYSHEIDIQECVGYVDESFTESWALGWDHIAHSNAIYKPTGGDQSRDSGALYLDTKNHENYHVHGAWWKSANEILIFLDGEHIDTLIPPADFDIPSYVQFSIEMYDWNIVPEEGSQLATLPEEDRISHVDWIRVWRPETHNF